MKNINILDSLTINKIAAGEVIENPASVIKELIENAIDADSTTIFIEIQNGGKTYMRITDDGYGISKLDIRKAFMRHATSKIQKVEDLNKVLSLGFRGEALASISAIAKVKLTTKRENEKNGHFIEIDGGTVADEGDIGVPKGTTIIIKDLFYNVPVRKKFLKTDKSETAKVSEVIHKMALSNPSISFKYVRDDKVIFRTSGNGDLKSVIYALFGRECAKSILAVDANENKMLCTGYISDSSFTKGSRSYFFTYVNGRYVFSPMINKAIEEAYKSYIMLNKFPAVFLNLQIDPKLIDINIHPKKLEIKFQNNDEVFSFIFKSVKNTIRKQMGPQEANLGFDQKEKKDNSSDIINLDEIIVKEIGQEADFRKSLDALNKENTKIDLDLFNVKEDSTLSLFNNSGLKTYSESLSSNGLFDDENSLFRKLKSDSKPIINNNKDLKEDYNLKEKKKNNSLTSSNDNIQTDNTMDFTQFDVFGNAPVLQVSSESEVKTKIKFEDRVNKLPNLQYKGTLFLTYILAEDTYDKELFIIDQHAAHERVNYEKFKTEFENEDLVLQELMTPEVIHLSNFELELAMEYHKELEKLGFELEEFGTNSIIMRSIPMIFGKPDTGMFFKEIIANLENLDGSSIIKLEKIMKIACTKSIKAGDSLDPVEIKKLLIDLSKCEDPYTCPHGRPTIVKLTKKEIEKYFKRLL